MSPEILRFLFDFQHTAITRNCDGLTHAESIVGPKAGNCANWVLGHILENRTYILQMLGGAPLWSESDGAMYARGTTSFDASQARDFETLRADLEVTQERIREAIARLDPAVLTVKRKPEDRRVLGEQLHFMAFHEAYHAGQLGLLRRIAGKPGAI